ncbi:SusC/RagA family TonB-linked outer membrane protein [Elizabethkingia anophelis]|uniref:SusC/RagA family TonB-linked outer membrane protein n=1 Tax=Elizabethkingia TaxID=308865 RepID=UPI001EE6C846|nr:MULTISPECIES: SusC/RagA family TonB-linked outer membrane protein [Elizabethkingia]MCT3687927.1 SusC/RagA family TonB-linked outer membrane protein [Elizabethkingia anophelis]MCT3706856.1 SusC/RagA family TonB-linked outer membrane protein [Elizabethkingia anophelis]MCT3713945.1 SusC/RagA family TonB-linked outer membrane protein [Elizabethkingia anophelis]MCT3717364.1 SusC/RagA family TonB-linked outer membrane protein [Elizabethkingia anophelis]MCT3731963.1 SusC/RagA family TonB-linked ou
MKKLTNSVLVIVLSSSFAVVSAQKTKQDTAKTKNIEEVVITGALGIKKKADALTSAQQVVSAEQLNQAGNPNAVQALVGKVAGLQINQTNSSVNSSNSIQLRGIRTITGNNDALVVIDNVISSASVLQTLPPDAIESINIIKGAQGAALYGADGVNGVVIVKTRQGAKNNRLSVSYDGTVDFETVAYVPKRQSKYGQGWNNTRDQYENGAFGPAFDGNITAYGLPMYDYNGDGVITLDGLGWGKGTPTSGDNPAAMVMPYIARPNEIKKFFRTGTTLNNSITLNAGGEGKYALLNLNNTRRDFIVQDDKSNKTSILFKGGAKVDKFTFEGGINYIRTDVKQTPLMYDENSNNSIFWNLLQSSPDIPITNYKNYSDNAFAWNLFYQNPYWRIKHVREDYKRDFFNATVGLGYEINKHINVKYTGNLQQTYSTSTKHRDSFLPTQYNGPGAADAKTITSAYFLDKREWFDYYGDLMLNFDYDLGSDFNLKVNLGHNYQDHRYQITQMGGTNLAVEGVYNIANVTKPLPASSTSLTNGTYRRNSHAVFANLDLAYKNFLFLNATARNEWSSVLPKNNNSYFYPSVGVSFVPTKAWDFGGNLLSYMKISGNWTRVGNSSGVSWYSINRTTELAAGFPFNGYNSYRNGMVQADQNIRPEFVTTYEANLDLGFFKDRIKFTGSIYQQDTKDLITDQTTSTASGINTKKLNIGQMRSKGADINLGFVPIKIADFRWDVNVGYSFNESRVLKVTDDAKEVNLQSGTSWGIFAQEGALFPLIKTSMMERDEQGRIKINPANGLPILTSELQNAGIAVPKSIYSFTTNISYKGFKLGAVADFRVGHVFVADIKSGLAFNGSLWDSGEVKREEGGFVMPNSVIPDGKGGWTPNTTVKTGGNNYATAISYFSTKYATYGENLLADGRAFKIREISLSYSLSKNIVRQYGLEEVTFGVHTRNPFEKFADNNLNYSDPETSFYAGNAKGVAGRSQYPNTRVYGFTLNLKF